MKSGELYHFVEESGRKVARSTGKIDSKGRVVIPAKLREELGPNIVVTLSLDDGYLSAYTAERFSRIKTQFEELNSMDPEVREVTRYLVGESLPCEIDGQGRVLISSELWEHINAANGDEISIVEYGDKLEICTKSFYEQRKEKKSDIMNLDLRKYDVRGL